MPKPKDDKQILSLLVETKLNGNLLSYERIPFGYVGYVYKADVDIKGKKEILAIKLSDVYTNPSEEEKINDRVYGTSYEDYESVPKTYDLITKVGIPTFKLLSFGLPSREIPYIYQIMSWLEGESVQELLASSSYEQIEGLHAVAGEIMGKLHNITRNYDGTAIQEKPFTMDWKNAFFTSFSYRLKEALKYPNEFLRSKKAELERFIEKCEQSWQDPKEFVLSHTDGLQGMAKLENNQWVFTGVVDIEDHRLYDQRFALAGYELQSVYNWKEVPLVFWEAYKKNKVVDSSYSSLRNLFWLYYVLSWFDIPYTGAWRGPEEDKGKVIKKNEDIIKKVIAGN